MSSNTDFFKTKMEAAVSGDFQGFFDIVSSIFNIKSIYISVRDQEHFYGFNQESQQSKISELYSKMKSDFDLSSILYVIDDDGEIYSKLKTQFLELNLTSTLILPLDIEFIYNIQKGETKGKIETVWHGHILINSEDNYYFDAEDVQNLYIIAYLYSNGLILSIVSKLLGNYLISVMHNQPLGMLTLTNDLKVGVANNAAEKIFGVKKKDADTDSDDLYDISEIFSQDNIEKIKEALDEINNNDANNSTITIWYKKPNFGTVLIKMIVSPFMLDDEAKSQFGDGFFSFYIFAEDITKEFEKLNIHKELEIAKQVQKSFLPEKDFSNSFADTCGISLPAKTIGGDYYDFILHDGNLYFTVADVSGKGISASMIMSSLKTSLQTLIETGADLKTIVKKLNTITINTTPPAMFITMFLAKYDFSRQTLFYCNMGHNPPILTKHNGEIEYITSGTSILGMLPELDIEIGKIELNKNDLLFCYTDGLTESMNPLGEQFEESRLIDIILETTSDKANRSAQTTAKKAVEAVKNFRNSAPQSDDITIVSLLVK